MVDKKRAVIFECNKNNFYSFASIIATIDKDPNLENLEKKIIDHITIPKLRQNLKRYSKIIVASSFRTAQIGDVYANMSKLYNTLSKDELKRILFVAGGSHATGDPESTLKLGYDYAFIGEGEYAFSVFLRNFLEGNDIKNTPNVAFLEEDNVVRKPLAPLIDLDSYSIISKTRKLFPPLEITRGCVFGCKFCQVPSMFNKKIRHRSPEIIFDVIKWMAKNNLYDIRFITPNSFGYLSDHPTKVNIDAIEYLLKTIKQTKGIRDVYYGTFPGEVRPETVSEELLERIKPYIANRRIAIGLQAGSEKVLKEIGRGHTLKEGIKAIDILRENGFRPVVDFIFGLPTATIEDEMQSIDVIKKLVKKGDKIRLHTFMPLPGTIYEYEKYGTVARKIRQKLGFIANSGKLEGGWTHQITYAEKTWKLIRNIKSAPVIAR